MEFLGSSPRMRGKQTWEYNSIAPPRLIPAHAGKTLSLAMQLILERAHPRACGENYVRNLFSEGGAGSSPRMRGKLRLQDRLSVDYGLIPAHAGKTDDVHGALDETRAHPRACGENFQTVMTMFFTPGSSPRMRGKLACGLRPG